MNNYKLGNDEKGINAHLKIALRAGVKNKTLKQSKGVGASGSFKLGNDKDVKEVKPKLKTVEKAPRAKAVPVKPEPPAAKKAKPAAEVAKKPAKPVKKAKAEAEAKAKKPKPGAAKKTKSPAKTKIAVQPPKAKSPKKEVKKASPKPKKVKASANPKTTKKAKSPAKAKRVTKASAKKWPVLLRCRDVCRLHYWLLHGRRSFILLFHDIKLFRPWIDF